MCKGAGFKKIQKVSRAKQQGKHPSSTGNLSSHWLHTHSEIGWDPGVWWVQALGWQGPGSIVYHRRKKQHKKGALAVESPAAQRTLVFMYLHVYLQCTSCLWKVTRCREAPRRCLPVFYGWQQGEPGLGESQGESVDFYFLVKIVFLALSGEYANAYSSQYVLDTSDIFAENKLFLRCSPELLTCFS